MDIPEGKKKLKQVISRLKQDLAKIRTGRASTDMLKDVKVETYDSKMPVEHVATISVPDARTINIKPWDKDNVEKIEKAIMASDIGLNPIVDGDMVRLSVPALTQERREEFVKEVKERVEQGKIAVRSVRHELMDELDDLSGEGGVSEDFIERKKDEVEDLISATIDELEKIEEDKKEKLMKI
jgi:ribosome recycling factor